MATTPPYGGQWKDPKTGQFDQAGYKNYIDTINKNYIDRLRTTPNAEGKYRTTAGYSVGGKDIGLGGTPAAAPAANIPSGPSKEYAGGGMPRVNAPEQAVNPAWMGMPRLNAEGAVGMPRVNAARSAGMPQVNSQYRPDVSVINAIAGARTGAPTGGVRAEGARTEGDERQKARRDKYNAWLQSLLSPAPASRPMENGIQGFMQEYFGTNKAEAAGAPIAPGESGKERDYILPSTNRPSYPTKVTGGGANMQAPSYDWIETNPPNQWLYGYGSSPPPVGGYEPVTPGLEFPGDPGIAGWRIDPNETEQAPTPAFGGGPALPAPSRGGGGGGGGGGDGGGYGGWGEYDLESHPEWWKGLSAGNSEDQQFASILNAMIPSMSPEDQRTAASTLARMFPEFESYNSLTNQGMTPPVPGEVTDATTQQYETTQRAQSILEAITRMGAAGGIKTGTSSEVSPAVAWLQQIADLGQDFGISNTTDMMTPTQLQALMAALDPLLAEAKGTGSKVAPYAEIARMLTDPFYSAGKVFPRSAGANGQMAFGQPNRRIF